VPVGEVLVLVRLWLLGLRREGAAEDGVHGAGCGRGGHGGARRQRGLELLQQPQDTRRLLWLCRRWHVLGTLQLLSLALDGDHAVPHRLGHQLVVGLADEAQDHLHGEGSRHVGAQRP